MVDGIPDYERIAIRTAVPGDATMLEHNQTQRRTITMKGSALKDWLGEMESNDDDQMTEMIADALSSNDKVIEIRPAKQSKGMGLKGLLLLGVGAVVFAYWVQNSQKPKDLIGDVKEKTVSQTDQAADMLEEESETVSERIESESEQAGKAVQEIGEKAADKTEEAGEKAADKTEEAGEKAADETDDDSGRFSGT